MQQTDNEKEQYFIVNSTGRDRSGLVAMLSRVISNAGFNIIDIEQSAPHGLFYMIMIIQPTKNAIKDPLFYFTNRFEELSAGTDLSISISEFKEGIRKELKSWLRVIFVGPDRPGLIAGFSDYTGKNNANIHRLNMISRGEIIASELLLDVSDIKISDKEFINGLNELGNKLGVQIIIESENALKKHKKKLLVIDLDENLIQIQEINQILEIINIYESDINFLSEINDTKDIIDIKQRCIEYLKGLDFTIIKDFISKFSVSPDTEEFIRAMKLMSYKIALVSNSMTIFADLLKQRLNLDYAFGNAIEVSGGKITGKYIKSLEINPQKKLRLINWLANMEKISEAEIVSFGLNESEKSIIYPAVLSQTADLKVTITFNSLGLKEMISEEKCSFSQIIAIFVLVGMSKVQIDEIYSIIK